LLCIDIDTPLCLFMIHVKGSMNSFHMEKVTANETNDTRDRMAAPDKFVSFMRTLLSKPINWKFTFFLGAIMILDTLAFVSTSKECVF